MANEIGKESKKYIFILVKNIEKYYKKG